MGKLNKNLTAIDKKLPSKDKVKRYDFAKKVKEPSWFFMWLEKFISKIVLKKYKGKTSFSYKGMQGLQTPYLILGTHMSFLDMPMVAKATMPTKVTYVSALDAMSDYTEWLMRQVGIIGKRKFIKDFYLLKNMKYSVTKLQRCALALYPEAKYSINGCISYVPPSMGKLIKYLNVPVVIARLNGNYISDPQWRKKPVVCPLHCHLEQIITKEELQTLSTEEMQQRVVDSLTRDDFAWQKENNIIIDDCERANGLNRLLYQCPSCNTEFKMLGEGAKLSCMHCGKVWEMTELGELKAENGETEFSHIPDWFEWQRKNVAAQIADGTYFFEDEVGVKTMPNAQRIYNHGVGKLTHSLDGFKLECNAYNQPTTINWKPSELDGCHIEYIYKGAGDAVDLSTTEDSYWLFPLNARDVLTKLSLATDELHRLSHIKD